jgi:hypothetical protein
MHASAIIQDDQEMDQDEIIQDDPEMDQDDCRRVAQIHFHIKTDYHKPLS